MSEHKAGCTCSVCDDERTKKAMKFIQDLIDQRNTLLRDVERKNALLARYLDEAEASGGWDNDEDLFKAVQAELK